ncbi:MAG: isoprenylcysteine carboxylmethyltransferase family protein [Desulfobacteraceae bacterium]|nr:isoprenylcysteine carboxylmethyltransferase family protein [Desulfobacteraceae bacterium]MBC2755301.1 isoprenylcysteine carboxylmethyltransferase family protein [Desulfobacteraceae bacterium]
MPESFLSQIHDIFNNKKVRKTFLKLRVPIGILLFILMLTQLKPAWFLPGLFVSILGQALQVWCMSTIKTKKKLTITGPYMFVRNPMYIGRFFLVFGILMMTGNPWLLILLTIGYYYYMVNRVNREEKILAELFGKDYEEFCRDVHPYLPGFKRFDVKQLGSFNKESFEQNNVLTNIVLPVICYFVLYLFTFVWPI